MLLLSFLAGLAGSLHCLGMCGPIVLAYAAQPRDMAVALRRNPLELSHLLYNGGRLLGYTALGAVAGLVGGMIGSVRLVAPYVAIVAGLLVVVTGVLLLGLFPRWSAESTSGPGLLRRRQFQWTRNLIALRTKESVFYLGVLTALLPCGLLYGMFLQAAASGSAFHGAVQMLAFGAGTAPALLFAGLLSSLASMKVRLFAHRLAAALLVVMGFLLIVRGVSTATAIQAGTAAHKQDAVCPLHDN